MNDWLDAAEMLLRLASYRNAVKSELTVRATEPAVSQEASDEVDFMLKQIRWEWFQQERREAGF